VYSNAVGLYQSSGDVFDISASPFYAKINPNYASICAAIYPPNIHQYNIDPNSNIDVADWSQTGSLYTRVSMEGCILDDA
jgi:hypothetical protein